MWNLDDRSLYRLIHSFRLSFARTIGGDDKKLREEVRFAARTNFPECIPSGGRFSFRIFVGKKSGREFDVDNVVKFIVDAFCNQQIEKDGSEYAGLGLFSNDTIDDVAMIQVAGQRDSEDYTFVEIFRELPEIQAPIKNWMTRLLEGCQ